MDTRDIVRALEQALRLAKRFDAASDAGKWDEAVALGMGIEHTLALLHRAVGDTVNHCLAKGKGESVYAAEEE